LNTADEDANPTRTECTQTFQIRLRICIGCIKTSPQCAILAPVDWNYLAFVHRAVLSRKRHLSFIFPAQRKRKLYEKQTRLLRNVFYPGIACSDINSDWLWRLLESVRYNQQHDRHISTTLATSSTSPAQNASVTLTATIFPSAATGTVTFYTVTFYDGSTEIGTTDLVSGSAVTALTTTNLAAGSHTITAQYDSVTSSSATVQINTATEGSFTSGSSCGKGTGLDVLSTGTFSTSGQNYSTSTADQSAICVAGTSSYLTLLSPTISTTSVTSNNDNSSFYGLDAAVLNYTGGVLTIDGGTITTSGAGGNLVFAYKTGTVTISNATISSSSSNNGHGLYAAGSSSAVVVANNVTATSTGSASSIVATDSGGGTIMDSASKWVVTGTSYLTALTDADTTYSNITCQTSCCKVYVGTTEIK
jgi:hypothetical protein